VGNLTPLLVISALLGLAVYLLVRYGWAPLRVYLAQQERWYDRVLNHQLLLNVSPKLAVGLSLAAIFVPALGVFLLTGGIIAAIVIAVGGFFLPLLVVRHLESKRRDKLEEQLVDGIVTLASGVRAGLNLVQAMELLVRNGRGPIRQEFAQLLREYQLGLDLNMAMRNAANRIGSGRYRLLFTAIEMHRLRGGATGESLDRIAEAIREIQRLEGKLDALTAQTRMQAWMMSAMPVVFLGLLLLVMPDDTLRLFVEPAGRILLLGIGVLVTVSFFWIKRIMAVDI
jgi:tight adherence protein B